MIYQRLVVFLEGNDDLRFFEKIVQPLVESKGYDVSIYQYARETPHKVNAYIKSINAMPRTDYLFFADYDFSRCISARVDVLIQKYRFLERGKIRIVIKEIESWYLAGLNNDACRKLKIPVFNDTNEVIKEKFDSLIPKKFQRSRIDFMQELLKHYDWGTAKQKNRSFHYLFQKRRFLGEQT